ncbi:hypothetical protein ACN9JG_06300 [Cereibacter azotoformans]|uniref:hypothetical protein n=1 Tax=Cereibacter azotoformans TaxID=43057 RepID=UPI003B20F75D
MKQPNTALDLDALFDAAGESIGAAFPDLVLVEDYPEDRRALPTPCCLLELIDLEPTDDPGTGQLAAVATMQARLLISFREPRAKRRVAKLAADVAHHVMGQRWGLPVEPARLTMIAVDDFDPELDRFEVWAVEWRQTIHIGASIWDDDGTPPTQVLASWSPDVGADHQGDYTDIGEATA